MPILLKPMTEEIFRAYLQSHEEDYARVGILTDREIFEQALQTTRPARRTASRL